MSPIDSTPRTHPGTVRTALAGAAFEAVLALALAGGVVAGTTVRAHSEVAVRGVICSGFIGPGVAGWALACAVAREHTHTRTHAHWHELGATTTHTPNARNEQSAPSHPE